MLLLYNSWLWHRKITKAKLETRVLKTYRHRPIQRDFSVLLRMLTLVTNALWRHKGDEQPAGHVHEVHTERGQGGGVPAEVRAPLLDQSAAAGVRRDDRHPIVRRHHRRRLPLHWLQVFVVLNLWIFNVCFLKNCFCLSQRYLSEMAELCIKYLSNFKIIF